MSIDFRDYGGEHYVTVADVRDGPLQEVVADAREGKYDKPELVFESGNVLSLNATNRKILTRAYGPTSDTLIGKRVDLVLGEVKFNGKPQEAAVVVPISPPLTAAEMTAALAAAPKPSGGGGAGNGMGDEIPF